MNSSIVNDHFRLAFNQVHPFREPLYDGALIKFKGTKPDQVEKIQAKLEERSDLSQHLQLFQVTEMSGAFLAIRMESDAIHMDLDAFQTTLSEFAPYLEDFQFFMYSIMERQDHNWLIEYVNQEGRLTAEKIICDRLEGINYSRLLYYIDRVHEAKEKGFKLFTTWQLYDRLSFLFVLPWKNHEERDEHFLRICSTDESKQNKFFEDFSAIYKELFAFELGLSQLKADYASLKERFMQCLAQI